jgi:hypothetical protein
MYPRCFQLIKSFEYNKGKAGNQFEEVALAQYVLPILVTEGSG